MTRTLKPSMLFHVTLALLLACVGCRLVLDIDEKHFVPSTGGAGAAGTAGGADAGGGAGGVGGETASCVDLSGDPGNCGACGHDCLGGRCDSGQCAPHTIFTADDACAFDLAVSDGYVYFTDYFPLLSADGQTLLSDPRVWRMRYDGSDLQEIFDTGDPNLHPTAIAVDGENVFLTVYGYFSGTGSVWRFDKDGADAVELTDMWSGPRAIALDSSDVYFTSANGPAEIGTVSKAGGDGQVLHDAPEGAGLFSIAVDEDWVYFSDHDHSVFRMPKTGGAVTTVDDSTAAPFPVLLDGPYVYWHDTIGLWRKPRDGSGAVEQIASGSEAWDLAADDSYIYMAAPDDGEVRRSPKAPTGQSEEVIAMADNVASVVVDDEAIYWSSRDNEHCEVTKLAR